MDFKEKLVFYVEILEIWGHVSPEEYEKNVL